MRQVLFFSYWCFSYYIVVKRMQELKSFLSRLIIGKYVN
ncbi:Argininosuccinate lyase-Arginosuccinase [Moritella viscosa]|nr:Argininosuccinate lyase-Arginosuccinase [Moritella viscosa]